MHAIVDVETAQAAGWQPAALAKAFLDGGARLIQIRAKAMPSAAFLALCDEVVAAARSYTAEVIVNDRADLARLSGAAGAHVGQEDLAPRDVRAVLGPTAIVGRSTHTLDQVAAAAREPVSYIAVGPLFGTTTKQTGYEARGLEFVTAAAGRAAGLPLVGIGGITLERAPQVLAAGAAAVAVIGDLLAGGDPAARVAAYCRALAPGGPGRP